MKYLIACLVLTGLMACSNNKITAAGVIAYTEQDGQPYILLADHTGLGAYRGYAAFGGGLEEGETLEQGALREFHEETACHFLGQIQSVSKEYVRNHNYVSFVVRVPFISSEQLNQGSQADECAGSVYSERANWIWVEQGALLEQLQTGDGFKNDQVDLKLWDKSTVIIKQAAQQGLLP
jgi:ADP-ribose pyrophosphatase YjhB (NUDIX family)